MQIINKGILSILIPEDGYELINKRTGIHSDKVYLAKNDSMDNYIEKMKEGYIGGLSDLKEQSDMDLKIIMDTIDGLIVLLEPILMSIPFSIDESSNNPIDKIIIFYTEMVKRGLKKVDDIPLSFRELVSNNIK